jgi:hypothetical protein
MEFAIYLTELDGKNKENFYICGGMVPLFLSGDADEKGTGCKSRTVHAAVKLREHPNNPLPLVNCFAISFEQLREACREGVGDGSKSEDLPF